MRSSPGIRRAPVHAFADGALKHVPKRSVDQALKHEVIPTEVPGVVEAGDDDLVLTTADGTQWPIFESSTAQAIALRPLTTEDVDQLWDWSREDPEGVKAFLGEAPANSRALFAWIAKVEQMQLTHQARIRAITRDAAVIGFVMAAPIQHPKNQPPVGTLHLYVTVAERGQLSDIVHGMLADFDTAHEPMTLSVIVTRPEWAHILTPLGFTSYTVLTRPATPEMVNTDG